MSRVVFMCGPSGSGKSTYARRLEAEGWVRLSFDVEMWRRGISTVPLPPAERAAIEADLRTRLLELVESGADVVLDFSFWSRRMREDYRDLLEPTGVVPETIYLATDRGTVLARMRTRRGSGPDDFVLDEELVGEYFDHFEPPTPDEGPLTVVGAEPVTQTGVVEALDETAYLGLPLQDAVSKGEREGWYVRVVREDSILTMDLRTDRLNLRVDDDDTVVGAEVF